MFHQVVTASSINFIKKSPYLSKDIVNKITLDYSEKDLTNIEIFKLYVQEYLKNNPAVYTQGFTFSVRQLKPTVNGLPIEIYIFVKEVSLVGYEKVQAEIFEHIISVLPEFKLKIFQNVGIV